MQEEIFKELQTIKKLVVVLLAKLGSTSTELADALGLDEGTIRKWVSIGKVEKIKGK